MKPKHYVAFMAVLGSLCWFAMMLASQVETLTTAHARFLFIASFIFVICVGIFSWCYLFSEMCKRKG